MAKRGSIKVLSLDGGGVRGLYTLHVLKAIEVKHGISVNTHFDVFGGTSTGGILALAYASGHSTDELLELYRVEIPRIFHRTLLRRILTGFGLFQEKYSNRALKAALLKYLGDRPMKMIPKPVFVTSVNITDNSPYIVGPQSTMKAVDAGLATSAAPTYFEPLVHEGAAYCDGGLLANNPSTLLISEVMKHYGVGTVGRIAMLSVGTGYHPHGISPERAKGMGAVEWAGPISGAMMSTQAKFFHDVSSVLLPRRYMRINSELSVDIDLASTVPEELEELRALGDIAGANISREEIEFILG